MAEIILTKFVAEGLDTLSAELGQVANAQEQVIQGQVSLRSQLRQNQQALAQLALAGKQNTEEYKKLRDEAGKLKDAISDAAQEIATAGSDTRGLDKALRAANVLVGGFAAVQGATALFGKESENLQKTLLKVNAAMSILAGLQQIQEELTRKDSIFTSLAAKAKVAYTAATAGATAATRALKTAMLGLIGGAILAGIILLVKNWEKLSDAIGLSSERLKSLKASLEKLQETQQIRNAQLEFELNIMQLLGKTDEERMQAKIVETKIQIEQNRQLREQLRSEKELLEARRAGVTPIGFSAALYQKYTKQIKEANDAIQQTYTNEAELNKVLLISQLSVNKLGKETETGKDKTDDMTESTKKLTRELFNFQRAVGDITRQGAEGGILPDLDVAGGVLKRWQKALEDTTDNIDEKESDLSAKRKQRAIEYLQGIHQTTDQINSITNQAFQVRLNNLQNEKEQGLITEKQYAREVAKIQEKQAKANKAFAISQALINTALAITSIFAQPIPFFAKVVQSALLGALAAAQIAIIAKQQIPNAPGFKTGVIDLQGEGTTTSDSIHARLSKGESVMTAEETKNHKEVLWAIRKKKFDKMFVPTDEVIKKHKPLSIPSGAFRLDTKDHTAHKLDKIYEELVYQNIYTKEGNRVLHKSSHHLQALKTAQRYGIRV